MLSDAQVTHLRFEVHKIRHNMLKGVTPEAWQVDFLRLCKEQQWEKAWELSERCGTVIPVVMLERMRQQAEALLKWCKPAE